MPASIHLYAAWDEYEPAQLALRALRDVSGVEVDTGDLRDADGHTIAAANIDVRMERFYALHLSYRYPNILGVVPKTLEPLSLIDVPAGTTRPYWVTVHVPDGQPAGTYRGSIAFRDAATQASVSVPLDLEVLPRRLDEPQILLGPLSLPVLRSFPKAGRRQRESILERADLIFADIRAHGMTTMSLWSGATARQDNDGVVLPDLDAAIDLFRRHRFPQPLLYAPVNLLRTNKIDRSFNYRHYNATFHVPLAAAITRDYTRRAAEAGLPGIIFDPIEEPNYAIGLAWRDAPDLRQRIATELLATIKNAGGTTAMTCTPETANVGKGNLDYWLVAYKRFTPGVLAQAERAGAHAALYANNTLMGNGTYFSRFFFGYYPWAVRLAGMMAWTYPMLPKRFPANIDAERAEGPHDVRSGFLGADGKPVPTIQWELAREGVDDFRYLVTLENQIALAHRVKAPEAARLAAEAERFLDDVRASVSKDAHRYAFEDPHTFAPRRAVGWDEATFETTRRRSFDLVKQLTAALGGS
jgi:hypothetical protein